MSASGVSANGARPPAVSGPAISQALRYRHRPTAFLDRARRELGDTFRIRIPGFHDAVVISDPDSVRRMFTGDRAHAIARHTAVGGLLGAHSLVHQAGDVHLSRRRLISPALHSDRLREYEESIAEATEHEVAGWPEGRAFALHPSMQRISLEAILRVVFGIQDASRRETLRDRIVAVLTSPTAPPIFGPMHRLVRALPPYRRFPHKVELVHELLDAEIAMRRRDPNVAGHADVLSSLIGARFEDGSQMDDLELRQQLATMLMAGHETTATSLAWCFDFLLHHPRSLERLIAELEDEATDYLDAVIDETLRLRPAAPMTPRRLGEATELDGYRLPAGTTILIAIYLTNTREQAFPDSHAFRPERFLDDKPESYSWIPFGGGVRRCVGAAFSQLEMRTVLGTVFRAVRLAPARRELDVATYPSITIRPRRGAPAINRGPL